jgi:hypothetical protein
MLRNLRSWLSSGRSKPVHNTNFKPISQLLAFSLLVSPTFQIELGRNKISIHAIFYILEYGLVNGDGLVSRRLLCEVEQRQWETNHPSSKIFRDRPSSRILWIFSKAFQTLLGLFSTLFIDFQPFSRHFHEHLWHLTGRRRGRSTPRYGARTRPTENKAEEEEHKTSFFS